MIVQRRRSLWLISSVFIACGSGTKPNLIVKDDAATATNLPLVGISEDWLRRFNAGDVEFERPRLESGGLGPLYIRASCAACHAADGKGPGGVQKFAHENTPFGHTTKPQLAAGATTPIRPPDDAQTSLRIGPAVFGRGYIDAVDESEIVRVEAEQASRNDGISGRINRVTMHSENNPASEFRTFAKDASGLVGRFGVKARVATMDDFVADAYQGDMGMTSPLRPTESPNPDGLTDDEKPGVDLPIEVINNVADYVRLLQLPKRKALSQAGQTAFVAARCDVCHTPSLRTRSDYPIPQLASQDAAIYSDLLLHDMGDHLADGQTDESASAREWRSAPLIGLRFLPNYLHDGRTKDLREAILLHASPSGSVNPSEANDSIERFLALDAPTQQALIDFVAAL